MRHLQVSMALDNIFLITMVKCFIKECLTSVSVALKKIQGSDYWSENASMEIYLPYLSFPQKSGRSNTVMPAFREAVSRSGAVL